MTLDDRISDLAANIYRDWVAAAIASQIEAKSHFDPRLLQSAAIRSRLYAENFYKAIAKLNAVNDPSSMIAKS